jgi:hypothetical protein
MISITAFATTSKLEQKQKTELRTEPLVQIKSVNVENDFKAVSVFTEVQFLKNIELEYFKISINSMAVLKDLGWQKEKQTYQLISYPDKLLENYNLNFKNQFDKGSNTRSR